MLRFSRPAALALAFASILWPTATAVAGLQATLAGSVVNTTEHALLEGVLVEVLDSGSATVDSDTTDADGLYEVGPVPTGTYDVRFSHADHFTRIRADVVLADGENFLSWVLVPYEGDMHPKIPEFKIGEVESSDRALIALDDNHFMKIDSEKTKPGVHKVLWQANYGNIPTSSTSLIPIYKGKNSRGCTQVVSAFHVDDGKWKVVDQRTVGTSEELIDTKVKGEPTGYIKGSGQYGTVRVRYSCVSHDGAFTMRTDEILVHFQSPKP